MTERVGKITEKGNGPELIHSVTKTLLPYLTPERRTQLTEVLPFAVDVAETLGMTAEASQLRDARAFDRGLLLMGIVSEWMHKQLFGNEQFEIQLAHVILPDERTYQLADFDGTDYNQPASEVALLQSIVEEAWPDSINYPGGCFAYVQRYIAKDFIAVIPTDFHRNSRKQRFIRALLRNGIAESEMGRFDFDGIAYSDTETNVKVGFVWQEMPSSVADHERNHLKFPGLSVGRLAGPNEMVTEWKARLHKYGNPMQKIYRFPTYEYLHVLNTIFTDYPYLEFLFITRYDKDSLENSIRLAAAFINSYSLSIHKKFYFIHPLGGESDFLQDNKAGYESPGGFLEMIRSKREHTNLYIPD